MYNIPIKNEHYEIKIQDISQDGSGIGKISGFTVFVENALPGDYIETRIVKVLKHYAYGKLISIINRSPKRVDAKCPVVNKCGGCTLQNFNYNEQLVFKKNIVENALKRIGGFDNITVSGITGMGNPFNYRNKAVFPIGVENGAVVTGFYSKRSHRLAAVSDCAIQHTINKKITNIVTGFLGRNNISIYDEKLHKGLVRHLLTKTGYKTGEIMVCLVINGNNLPKSEEFVNSLLELPGMSSISLNINTEKTNVILGGAIKNLYGEGFITDYIGRLKFQISPLSFFQVNPVQTEALYNAVLNLAGLSRESIVLDAYCGIGTISLSLSTKAKKVIGVEIIEQAVGDAFQNARINNIENVHFVLGKVEDAIQALFENNKFDTVILDPPRKGCSTKLINALLGLLPQKIIYVSCGPATLARDLKLLAGEYIINNVQLFDMFPMTCHVESVVLLTRKDG